jgi:hypothetical protein
MDGEGSRELLAGNLRQLSTAAYPEREFCWMRNLHGSGNIDRMVVTARLSQYWLLKRTRFRIPPTGNEHMSR